jgi:hypothetical protein
MAVFSPARKRRYMSGSSSRLAAHYAERQHKSAAGIHVPYRRFTELDLDAVMGEPAGTLGSVRVWRTIVLHDKESKPAREFAPPRGAEVWTLNGQTHVTRSDAHFKSKRVGLDALVGHLLVAVDLDGLSADAKADVITTGRHTRAQREIGTRLEDAVDQVLGEDDQLEHWNTKIREAAFKKAASQQIAGLEKALRAFSLTFKRKKTIPVPGTGDRKYARPQPKLPDPISPLHEHPRDVFGFRMVVRDTIKVRRGSTGSVQLEADALDGYFDDANRLSLQFVADLGDKLRIVGRDSLEGGRMRIRMKATRDAPLVAVKLNATCVTPVQVLTAVIDVEVVEPTARKAPRDSDNSKGQQQEIEIETPPPVEVHYQYDKDHSWLEGWNEETVGEYKTGIAHINGDYSELVNLRKELPKSAHDDITNVYIAPIAMTIVGLADAERDAPKDADNGEIELPDHFRRAAMRSAALSSIFALRYMNKSGGFLVGSDDEGNGADAI